MYSVSANIDGNESDLVPCADDQAKFCASDSLANAKISSNVKLIVKRCLASNCQGKDNGAIG